MDGVSVYNKESEGIRVEILSSIQFLIVRVYIKGKCYSISNIVVPGDILVNILCEDKEVENIIACALVENPKLARKGPESIQYHIENMNSQIADIIMSQILEDVIFMDLIRK